MGAVPEEKAPVGADATTADEKLEPDEKPAVVDETGTHPSTVGHGHPSDAACSVLWDADATSAFGTAARATFFVVLEQPGPWGRDAARESHLEHDLGRELDARCARAGGRFMLMRRPGGHPDKGGPRTVLVGHTGPDPTDAWLVRAHVEAPADLLGLDWSALSRGYRGLVAASLPRAEDAEPTLLVCTNGRRDVCCAVRGRPLAAAAARVAPGRAWEVSHTGGHRFAPTAVLLPWGLTYARLDEQSAEWVLGASRTGHTPHELLGPGHERGRAPLSGPEQCAESFLRAQLDETRIGVLRARGSEATEAGHVVIVAHDDGRTWQVQVTRVPLGTQRPETCGKKAVDVAELHAEVLSATF